MPSGAMMGLSTQRLAAVLLILATAIPVLVIQTPPMIDVPGHIGRYALQTGLDAHPWWQTFYGFRWRLIGNLGADLLVQAVYPLLGLEGAVRLVVLLVPLLTASAIMLLSREIHGRLTAFGVLALTLIYGLPFTWGFLNFSLAMALALLAFCGWLRLTRTGRVGLRSALFLPVSLAVWTCHTYGWAFLGILCAGESLARFLHRDRSHLSALMATATACLPLLAPLLPMLLWRSTATDAGVSGWFDWAQKLEWTVSILRLHERWTDIVSASVLIVAIYVGLRSDRVRADRGLALSAALAGVAFLVLPKQIFGSVFADMRLAPYAAMLALLALGPVERPAPVRQAWMAAALLFLAFRLGVTTHVYRERSQLLDQQLTALSAIPPHARVAMLVSLPCPAQWEVPWYSHVGSLALARKEVFVNDQWANSSMNPLTVHYPAAGEFATDDRQLFYPQHCSTDARKLSDSLRGLPAAAFTHVWIVGVPPATIPKRRDLTMIWQRRDAAVFAVRR